MGTNLHATRLEELYHEVEADLRQVHVTGNRFRRVLRLVGPEGAPLRLAIVMVPGQPELGEVHLSLTWLDG